MRGVGFRPFLPIFFSPFFDIRIDVPPGNFLHSRPRKSAQIPLDFLRVSQRPKNVGLALGFSWIWKHPEARFGFRKSYFFFHIFPASKCRSAPAIFSRFPPTSVIGWNWLKSSIFQREPPFRWTPPLGRHSLNQSIHQ